MLNFGTGVTYTELRQVRAKLYAERGPALLREIMEKLSDLSTEVSNATLLDLSDLSCELGALEPAWTDFSVECFQALLVYGFCGAITVYSTIMVAFDRCLQSQLSAKGIEGCLV